jgi:DNA-binding transcriptional MerR regulator
MTFLLVEQLSSFCPEKVAAWISVVKCLSKFCYGAAMYRIGELARRTGASADLLRAWERRYGLLRPERTAGGFRVYTDADVTRVGRMRSGLDSGLAAAEAARLALDDAVAPDLLAALLAFDDERAHASLDDAVARLSVEAVLADLVLPAFRAIGDGWAAGSVSVAQEHYAANLVRARLLGLARRWDQGVGPRALLACAPGDLHDLPLICFGLALRQRGWRILFLGADTPLEVVAETAALERPDVVVLASAIERPELDDPRLGEIAASAPLTLAGQWPEGTVSARRVAGDPVELAATVSRP